MRTAPFNLLVILGPTASGKTRLAVQLAEQLNGEIISADSRQVYRGLDIGSGKDLQEYNQIPYHLIDILDPGEEYSVYQFQQDFFDAYSQVCDANKLPILAGGTGLYVDAVTRGYRFVDVPENPTLRAELAPLSLPALQQRLLHLKPEQHNTTDLLERARLIRAIEIAEKEQEVTDALPPLPTIRPCYLGLKWPRTELRQRITQRLHARLEQGLVEEVEQLHAQGVSFDTFHYLGLEYRFVSQYLQGQLNFNDMKQKLNSAIHQYAKRQDTWFRKLEKRGETIHWLDGKGDPLQQALAQLNEI